MADIRFDSDAQAALADFDRLAQATKKFTAGVEETTVASRKAAGEERQLGRLRERLLRDAETAQERYTRRLREATKALDGVEISEQDLGRIRETLHQKYLKELAKEREALDGVEKDTKEVKDSAAEASAELDGTFDADRLAQWAAGYLSIQAIVTKTLSVFREQREEVDRLGEKLGEITESSGNLVQLAGSDQALRDRLFAASDQAFASGLVRTREEADRLIFELQSAGRLGDLDFFTQLNAVDNAALLAKSSNLIATGFGADETGGSADIVSKLIAGALPATGVSPSDIAEGVARAAASGSNLGLTDEEVTAAVSRVAELTGSGSEAGSRVQRLFSALARQGLGDELQGQGIEAFLEAIGARAGTTQELTQFLGSVEAVQAFGVLRDTGALRERIGEIDTAQRGGLAEQTIENALGSERISATIAARRARAQGELARQQEAEDEKFADAAIERRFQQARATSGGFNAALLRQVNETFRFFAGNESFAREGRLVAGAERAFRTSGAAERTEQANEARLQADAARAERQAREAAERAAEEAAEQAFLRAQPRFESQGGTPTDQSPVIREQLELQRRDQEIAKEQLAAQRETNRLIKSGGVPIR